MPSSRPAASTVVRSRSSGPNASRAAAVVTSLVVDAGFMFLPALRAYRILPVRKLRTSTAQKPGANVGRSRTRSIAFGSDDPPGSRAAAETASASEPATITEASEVRRCPSVRRAAAGYDPAPLPGQGARFLHAAAGCGNRGMERHGQLTRPEPEQPLRGDALHPRQRDRDHRHAGLDGEDEAALLEGPHRAVGTPGPFREDGHAGAAGDAQRRPLERAIRHDRSPRWSTRPARIAGMPSPRVTTTRTGTESKTRIRAAPHVARGEVNPLASDCLIADGRLIEV